MSVLICTYFPIKIIIKQDDKFFIKLKDFFCKKLDFINLKSFLTMLMAKINDILGLRESLKKRKEKRIHCQM